jgi:threonine synthase
MAAPIRYHSLKDRNVSVSFREAVSHGIAGNMGLYVPERIPRMDPGFFRRLPGLTLPEIAFEVGSEYIGVDIPYAVFRDICNRAFDFPVVLRQIARRKHVLELFHGPTAAFKDFGARFMSQCFGYFSSTDDLRTVVLVATSGDTGGAIANSFLGIDGVDVVILYPSGKVSPLQENQLTTLGHNITALEVEGTFDDCQAMVKAAFASLDTRGKIKLTSANSINIARLIPQSFYYYYALSRVPGDARIISVPCGNFGNLTAAVMAWKSGLEVKHFIASTNVNKVVPEYLRTGLYKPSHTVATIANAMDVGNPGNYERMIDLFDSDHGKIASVMSGYWFDDDQIRQHISDEYRRSGYILDPHGAVASLGLEKYLNDHPGASGVFVETAHPAKFSDIIEHEIGKAPEMPLTLSKTRAGRKESILIGAGYPYLKEYLRQRYSLS